MMSYPGPERLIRNFLLDRRLQLRFSAYAVAAALMVAALLGGYLWQATRALFGETEIAVDARSKTAEISRELGNVALSNRLFEQIDDRALEEEFRAKSRAIDAHYDAEQREILSQKEQLHRQQTKALIGLILALVALVAIVAGAAIVATHRVAGPAFRLRRAFQNAAQGKLPDPTVSLRPGDELNELFLDFALWAKRLRESEQSDIQTLEEIQQLAKQAARSNELEERILAILNRKRARL